jgi:hypothetical protein
MGARKQLGSMMPATTIETTMVAAVEAAKIMPACVATVMRGLMTMPMMVSAIRPFHEISTRQVRSDITVAAHRLYVSPIGTEMGPGRPNHCEHDSNENDCKNVHTDSIAAATAATTAASTARESARWLGGSAVTRPIRRAENRKLQGVLFPRALRASNLLRLIQHNLLKVRLAILANVFVNRHGLIDLRKLSIAVLQ